MKTNTILIILLLTHTVALLQVDDNKYIIASFISFLAGIGLYILAVKMYEKILELSDELLELFKNNKLN